MATHEERLEQAADLAENASAIAESWANGDEFENVTPEPASGPMPTIKEFMRQNAVALAVAAAFPGELAETGSTKLVGGVQAGDLANANASPVSFGAPANGIDDDSAAWLAQIALTKYVDARNRTWRLSNTVNLPDGTVLNLEGASIVADTPGEPLFYYDGRLGNGLTIKGQHTVTGTCDSFLKAERSPTVKPTDLSGYARLIRIDGANIQAEGVNKFLHLKNARDVYLTRCYTSTINGIVAEGKNVEVHATACVIFARSGGRPIKISSPHGGDGYNEGWHFTDCTIDGGESLIQDIFVMTFNGGYLGGDIVFQEPTTTTHTRDMTIGDGTSLGGKVSFLAPVVGHDFRAEINGNFSEPPNNCIRIGANASGISTDIKANSAPAGSPTAVLLEGNNTNCNIAVEPDNTFGLAAEFKVSGARNSIEVKSNFATGAAFTADYGVRVINCPVRSAAAEAYVNKYVNVQGNFAVGAVMATVSVSLEAGTRGEITAMLPCTGLAAPDVQRFVVGIPAGMVVPNGGGWSAVNVRPMFASGMLTIKIPFYCSASILAGNVTLTNSAGNTAGVGVHGWFSVMSL